MDFERFLRALVEPFWEIFFYRDLVLGLRLGVRVGVVVVGI